MRILNLGSLNLDKVYHLKSFVTPGETTMAESYGVSCGGKGLNQSVAIARAGAEVSHIGMVGSDGQMLTRQLESDGVNIDNIGVCELDTGHAVIQVDGDGQNCIIVTSGANGQINKAMLDKAIANFSDGDIFLAQNETSCVDYAIIAAHNRGMKVAFNPSPITPQLLQYPLQFVDTFILNEIEGAALSGYGGDNKSVLEALSKKFPKAEIILTVGADGAYYEKNGATIFQPTYKVTAVDTTGAGDTFTGFYLASAVKGQAPESCLRNAAKAAAIAVSRNGAAPSIPSWQEMQTAHLE